MQILNGNVQWNGSIYPCTYGNMEDGRQYYFKQELSNGNIIVTTALIEFVDNNPKAKNFGLIDKDGNEIIPCTNSSIKALSDDLLLVEPAEAVSENVKEANALRTDPLAATRLVSTPAQIKEKINAKMSPEGRYVLNDQFKDGTICDINGNNLINNEYYSFVAIDKDKLFMAKNNPETDVVEFSLTDKKVIEDKVEEVQPVGEVVEENVPAEVTPIAPVEESQPVENINEGFAKEDIDLGQEISIPQAEEPVQAEVTPIVPVEQTQPVEEVVEQPVQEEVAPVNEIITEPIADNFSEITEETPNQEIDNNDIDVEVENRELTDQDFDNRESELERNIRALNELYSKRNDDIDSYFKETEKDDDKDLEFNDFSDVKVDSIVNVDEDYDNTDYSGIEESIEGISDKPVMKDATNTIRNLMQKHSEQTEELNEVKVTLEKVKASRKIAGEKLKVQDQKIEILNNENRDLKSENHELKIENAKLEDKLHDQVGINDLQRRELEKYKLENQKLRIQLADADELADAVKDAEALINDEKTYYENDSYSYSRRAA